MKKLCSPWVLRLFLVDQKQQRVDNSERFLQLFQRNNKDLREDKTMRETWIYHLIRESNGLSAECTAADEICPKWSKMQTSASKIFASVFWDAQGILSINYCEKRRAINSKYVIALFVCLKEEIAKSRNKWRRKKCFFAKTMHRVKSGSHWRQNDMNCPSNWFRSHPILQIWPPAITVCLQA